MRIHDRVQSAYHIIFTLLIAIPAYADCRAYVLRELGNDLSLEAIEIEENGTEVVTSSEKNGVIDVILPVGPGTSGSIVKAADGNMHVLRCQGGALSRQTRNASAETSTSPERKMVDLESSDVRLSVVAGNGKTTTFLISGWSEVRENAGPVQNLFGGLPLPLTEDDYILTTETYPRQKATGVKGSFPVEAKGHLFAKGTGPTGSEGWFLIDTGGTRTVVSKSFLSDDAILEKAGMVEYSIRGKRDLDFAPGGATGTVRRVIGVTSLPELRFGDVRFEDVPVLVVDEMPSLFERSVVGIVGIDLLRRAEVVELEIPMDADGTGSLKLREAPALQSAGVPFLVANEHLFVEANIAGNDAHMILDSGAPDILLDEQTAKRASISGTAAATPVRGLDEGRAESQVGTVSTVRIGEHVLRELPVRIARLVVFDRFRRDDQNLGLLGNRFFGRFERIEIDFSGKVIRFGPTRENPRGTVLEIQPAS